MGLKNLIISVFPSLYINKHFTDLKNADITNYKDYHLEPELFLLSYFLNRDESFVDVGSNKGLYVFQAKTIVEPERIFAFEPNPTLASRLRSVFKKVVVSEIALSSEKGNAILSIPFTNSDPDDSLAKVTEKEVKANAFNFPVQLNTLDNMSAELKMSKVGLIKIDVEGNELKVLEGASNTLVKFRPNLLVEIEERHHQLQLHSLINEVCSHFNYIAYYFSPSQNKICTYNAEMFKHQKIEDFGTYQYINNFFFVPSEKDPEIFISRINSKIESTRK